jgi:uncharacterized protein YecE (DUF72 family)
MPGGSPYVGTAGWSVPRACAERFAGDGTHLQRYSRVLSAAEINSSFHRPHAAATYARWAASAPGHFRFAVKVPRAITHDARLIGIEAQLDRFLDESAGLGEKRGPLLVQLPPSLAFDEGIAGTFFDQWRQRFEGPLVCEPRHATWMTPDADALLVEHRVARVAADPARAAGDDRPGGWPGLVYYRWHGAPRTYCSRYEPPQVSALAERLRAVPDGVDAWCIFDNTASGAALENAFELEAVLNAER